MFCKNCGTELKTDACFCPACGTSLLEEPRQYRESAQASVSAPEADATAASVPDSTAAAQEATDFTQPTENPYGYYPPQTAEAPVAPPHTIKNNKNIMIILSAATVTLIFFVVVLVIALASKSKQSAPDASSYGTGSSGANSGYAFGNKSDSSSLISQMEGTWVALFSRKYVSESVQPKYYKTVNFKIESSGRIAFIMSSFDLNMKGDSLSESSITDEGDGVYSIKGTTLPFYILYNTKLDEMVFYLSYEGDVYFMEMHRGND